VRLRENHWGKSIIGEKLRRFLEPAKHLPIPGIGKNKQEQKKWAGTFKKKGKTEKWYKGLWWSVWPQSWRPERRQFGGTGKFGQGPKEKGGDRKEEPKGKRDPPSGLQRGKELTAGELR